MDDQNRGQAVPPVAVADPIGGGDSLTGLPQSHDESLEQVEMQLVSYRHDGPLPAPQVMAGYQRVNPAFPERIMRMAEREMEHRHARELSELGIIDGRLWRGQVLGGACALGALAVAAYALFLGHPATAAIIGGTTVVGLATVFVIGRRSGAAKPSEAEAPDDQQ